MAAVATRMAIEVSCSATAFDFTRPAAERLLFPLVEVEDTPDFNEGAIRKNIVHLHDRILGETLEVDDPAVDATFALFYDTWTQGQKNMLDKIETNGLGPCPAVKDPTTNTDLPAERQIKIRRHLRHPRVAGRHHLSALGLQVPLRVSPTEMTMDRRSFLKVAAMTGLAVAAAPATPARPSNPTGAPSTS